MAKKVFVAVGHGVSLDGSWDCGCSYKHGGKLYTEADLMLNIAEAEVKYLRKSGIIVYTDLPKNNKNMIADVRWANRLEVDLYMSLHCDFYKAPAGTLPLYCSKSGKNLAACLNKAVIKDVKISTRGLSRRTDLYELNDTNMVSCIFECGSIKGDLKTFRKDYDAFGKALAKGVCDYLNVKFLGGKSKDEVEDVPAKKKPSKVKKLPKITLPKRGYFNDGDKGANVKALQEGLNSLGFKCGEADGIYGSDTKSGVNKFEKKYKLSVDGQFGKKCLDKYNKLK